MNTRILMAASALMMAVLGLGATFLPQEILARFGAAPTGPAVLLIQIAGALYLGFAMLNWMSRANRIGGIYNRSVAVGNLLHFAMVAITLLKAAGGGSRDAVVLGGLAVYLVFAIGFGLVVFTHPKA